MNCNDNVLFDSYISEDAWSSVLCSCAWVYVGSCAEKRVWVLGPGRNNPLKLTEIVSGGSRMLAAPIGCQTCEPGDVCVRPHVYSCRNCSHLHREALHLSHQMDKKMREMHRTTAVQPGDSVQNCGGTVLAPPAEPGCLCLPALLQALFIPK